MLPSWRCGRLGVAAGLRRARVPLPGQAGGHRSVADRGKRPCRYIRPRRPGDRCADRAAVPHCQPRPLSRLRRLQYRAGLVSWAARHCPAVGQLQPDQPALQVAHVPTGRCGEFGPTAPRWRRSGRGGPAVRKRGTGWTCIPLWQGMPQARRDASGRVRKRLYLAAIAERGDGQVLDLIGDLAVAGAAERTAASAGIHRNKAARWHQQQLDSMPTRRGEAGAQAGHGPPVRRLPQELGGYALVLKVPPVPDDAIGEAPGLRRG